MLWNYAYNTLWHLAINLVNKLFSLSH